MESDGHKEGRKPEIRKRSLLEELPAEEYTQFHQVYPADHIAKEDEMLFPMAAEMIPESDQDEVMAKFAHVEQDETSPDHAQLLELATRLEREAGTT